MAGNDPFKKTYTNVKYVRRQLLHETIKLPILFMSTEFLTGQITSGARFTVNPRTVGFTLILAKNW